MAYKVKKHHQRTIDRIHLLVRLELANPLLSGIQIAQLCGLKPQSYIIIKQHTLYRTIHNQYMTGVLGKLDTQVTEGLNLNQTQETLKFAVPMAMQALLKQALQEKDLRVQNKACNDILDRDGHFAKVTRVGLATQEQGGAGEDKDNKVAQEMIKALQQSQQTQQNTQRPNISDPAITETTQ